MKRLFVIFFLFAIVGFFNACNNNNAKKESAKNYIHEQLIGKNNDKSNSSFMDYDKKVNVITDKTFRKFTSTGVVLVDFWATWCKPCLMQAPIVEQLAGELGDKVRFGKIDVDRNKEMSEQFEILNIPTIVLFKDGKIVETLTGLQDKENLKLAILKYLQ